VPRRYTVLGTDGFGRSDTREKLRHFFEVDRHWITLAALSALADEGQLEKGQGGRSHRQIRPRPEQAQPGEGVSHGQIVEVKGTRHRRLQGRADHRTAGQGPGDAVKAEDPLMTLESDKATMDIPCPVSGVVTEMKVKVGDKVAEGTWCWPWCRPPRPRRLRRLSSQPAPATPGAAIQAAAPVPPFAALAGPGRTTARRRRTDRRRRASHADAGRAPDRQRSPRQPLGAPLCPRARRRRRQGDRHRAEGRITQADVQAWVKGFIGAAATPAAVAPAGTGTGLDLLPWPKIDFAKFGAIEVQPLSRIKKISGANLSRNWVMIPAVTYHEDADITDLEDFRVQINKENEKSGTSRS
jgi:pyruvate dehydrogenase E2 component (dihydrolipoamide acetyltransferase)